MKTLLLTLWLIASTWMVLGSESIVMVYGDVPERGWREVGENGEKLTKVLQLSGFELEELMGMEHCPVRITVEELLGINAPRIFDPGVDAEKIKKARVTRYDMVEVKDFRLTPEQLKRRRNSLSKYIEYGSTDLVREITMIAEDAKAYADWKTGRKDEAPEKLDHYLREELSRSMTKDSGERIIELIKLRIEFLSFQGYGEKHDRTQQASSLLQIAEKVWLAQSGKEPKKAGVSK